MIFLKKIYVPLLGAAICLLLPWVVNFGAFINKFYPCVQIEGNSAPCYITYSIDVFLIFLLAAVVFLGIVIFRTVKFFRGKRKDSTSIR